MRVKEHFLGSGAPMGAKKVGVAGWKEERGLRFISLQWQAPDRGSQHTSSRSLYRWLLGLALTGTLVPSVMP